MSRFLPAVVGARAMQKLGTRNEALEKALPDMVATGLQRLYGYQHGDGGWGWWTDDPSTAHMTAYVVYGLATARDAGFEIDRRTLKRGVEWLKQSAATDAFALYARVVAGDDVGPIASANVDTPTAEETAYLVLAGRSDLVSSLPVDPPAKAGPDEIRMTALVIRALAKVDAKDPRIAPLAAWLMSQRRGGSWISTLDTACAVYALTEIAARSPEPEVSVRLNGQQIAAKAGRIRIADSRLKPGKNEVEVVKKGGGQAYASAVLGFWSSLEQMPPERGALYVTRRLERGRMQDGERRWELLETGSEVQVGEELRMVVTVRASGDPVEQALVEAPLPAGTEAYEEGADWSTWAAHGELRDDRAAVAASHLDQTEGNFTFRLRATIPGTYHVMPAVGFAMYDPDKRGTSGELLLRVLDR